MATMTLVTSKSGAVSIILRGSGSASINWGDGKSDTYTLSATVNKTCSHNYTNSTSRTITITGNNMTYLSCDNIQATGLNVSGNTALENLSCSTNLLKTLSVSGFSKLVSLQCQSNQLTSLTLTGCSSLEVLYCYSNQLTSLSLSGLTKLRTLYCHSNQLASLSASGCTALENLYCYSNKLASLSVSGLTKLTILQCQSNQLGSLTLTGCSSLVTLSCYNNKLTSLSVSGFTKLTTLTCYSNQLTSLSASGCTSLGTLYCYSNKLTSLSVGGLALANLDCKNNSLSAATLNSLFNSLPIIPSGTSGKLYIAGNSGTNSCNVATAINKRWTVDYTPANILTLSTPIAKVRTSDFGFLTVTSGNSSRQTLTWESSNKSVVTVDSHGNYTGVAKGVADIIVKTADKLKEGTCKVYVYPEFVTSLGRGIDILNAEAITSDYINQSNQIIDIDLLNATGQIITDSDKKTNFECSVKESIIDVVTDFNLKNNVSYEGAAFTASVDVKYDTKKTENRTSKFIKASGYRRVRSEAIRTTNITNLKDFLTDEFRKDCASKSAADLLKIYGSHMMAQCCWGGIANVDGMYTSTQITNNTTLIATVKATFGKFGTDNSTTTKKETDHLKKNTVETIKVWGGSISATTWDAFNAKYDSWYDSLEKSPAVCGVKEFDEKTTMLPLWNLIELISPAKANDVKTLFNKNCTERGIKLKGLQIYSPVMTDINVHTDPKKNLASIPSPHNRVVLSAFANMENNAEAFEMDTTKILDCNESVKGQYINITYAINSIPNYNSYTDKAISDIIVLNGQNTPTPSGYKKIGKDLNEGAKGDYLYLCFKKVTSSDTEKVIDFVGGIIYSSSTLGNLPAKDNGEWAWVYQRNSTGNLEVADLNKGAKGKYIRLLVHKVPKQK